MTSSPRVLFCSPWPLVRWCRYRVWAYFHMFPSVTCQRALLLPANNPALHLPWCRARQQGTLFPHCFKPKISNFQKKEACLGIKSGDGVENKQKGPAISQHGHLSLISLPGANIKRRPWLRIRERQGAEDCFISWNFLQDIFWLREWQAGGAHQAQTAGESSVSDMSCTGQTAHRDWIPSQELSRCECVL